MFLKLYYFFQYGGQFFNMLNGRYSNSCWSNFTYNSRLYFHSLVCTFMYSWFEKFKVPNLIQALHLMVYVGIR